MIRKSAEKTFEQKQMFGGRGEAKVFRILEGEQEMYGKGRVFNHIVLDPGCEVAWHVHNGEGETYYILKGNGLYNDNGVEHSVAAGDVCFVDDGQGHAIYNDGSEPLEMIALILFKD